MILVEPDQIFEIESGPNGKLHVTFVIDTPAGLPAEPSYPPYNHTREDSELLPCPSCKSQAEACERWAKAALDRIDNKRFITALGVTGYALTGQSYTVKNAPGAVESEFKAWTLPVQFPNGDLAEILLPTRHQAEFTRELERVAKKNTPTPKSALDRILERDE